MPEGTRVHRCVDKLKEQGREEGSAIAICQSSTHQGFATGHSLKSLRMKYGGKNFSDDESSEFKDFDDLGGGVKRFVIESKTLDKQS